MYVHAFAAFFGLAATYFFDPKKAIEDKEKQCGGNYNSNLIAMVGTVFLWILWPSFNGALAGPTQQHRVIVNTLLAMTGACITACAMARILCNKLDMEVVLNATLAGGVMLGTSADLVVNPGIATLIGAIAGVISSVGFMKLSGIL